MKGIILGLFLLSVSHITNAQGSFTSAPDEIQIIFWNVENLFDTYEDSLKNDDEFLPYGIRGWNRDRYQKKLFNLYKTFVAIGQWKFPDMIALAEIENKSVLEDLIGQTPLQRAGYEIIHQESEDRRGIDLAILYRPESIQPLDTNFIRLSFPDDKTRKTRDIIYLNALFNKTSELHFFVNHWPSRYGGGKSSESRRIFAASVLREEVNQIINEDANASVIVTGDFNDTPDDLSLKILAGNDSSLLIISNKDFAGTHKHQGIWNHFDHMWVSKPLLVSETLYIKNHKAVIFHPEWLLEEDKTYGGLKPNRTYAGYQYHGGFSDHLPIYLKLKTRSSEALVEKEY